MICFAMSRRLARARAAEPGSAGTATIRAARSPPRTQRLRGHLLVRRRGSPRVGGELREASCDLTATPGHVAIRPARASFKACPKAKPTRQEAHAAVIPRFGRAGARNACPRQPDQRPLALHRREAGTSSTAEPAPAVVLRGGAAERAADRPSAAGGCGARTIQ